MRLGGQISSSKIKLWSVIHEFSTPCMCSLSAIPSCFTWSILILISACDTVERPFCTYSHFTFLSDPNLIYISDPGLGVNIRPGAEDSFLCLLNPWKVETSPNVSFGLPVGNVIFKSSCDSLTDVLHEAVNSWSPFEWSWAGRWRRCRRGGRMRDRWRGAPTHGAGSPGEDSPSTACTAGCKSGCRIS